MREYKAIVDAACRSRQLRILVLRGTLFSTPAKKTLIMDYLLQRLHMSYITCLNIGEFPDIQAHPLLAALRDSFVGNLYYRDPRNNQQRETKRRIKAVLKANKKKWGYRQSLIDDEDWRLLGKGCNAWYNPTQAGRDYALQYLESGKKSGAPFVERCRVNCRLGRCRATNAKRVRCCLCTRHGSYCHHHRKYYVIHA